MLSAQALIYSSTGRRFESTSLWQGRQSRYKRCGISSATAAIFDGARPPDIPRNAGDVGDMLPDELDQDLGMYREIFRRARELNGILLYMGVR